MKKQPIIDVEEYKGGHYHNSRGFKKIKFSRDDVSSQTQGAESGQAQSSKHNQSLDEKAAKRIVALYSVTGYDCLIGIATIGVIARAIMVLIYLITTYWIDYDVEFGFWGVLSKFFWIFFDVSLIRAWNSEMRPKLVCNRVNATNCRVVSIVEIIAWFVAGYSLKLAIFDYRLELFFKINRAMVMGMLAFAVSLLFYRIWRVMRIISKDSFEEEICRTFYERYGRQP